MSEIGRGAHFGDVLGDEVGGTAIAVARQDQRRAAERVPRSIRTRDLDPADNAIGARVKRTDRGVKDKRNVALISGLAQSIDQLEA